MRRLPLISALVLALAALPSAQTPSGGGLRGVVQGAGAAVPGADVTARQAGAKAHRTTTNGSGAYRFPALPPGTRKNPLSLHS